jgi:hypothetical protein
MAAQNAEFQQEQDMGMPSKLCATLCKKKIPNKSRGSRKTTW